MPSDGTTSTTSESGSSGPSIEVELRPARAAGYAALVTLRGEHDLATSDDLAAALAPIAGNLLIDLSQCEFIDSTVIGVVIGKSQELTRDGHRLELVVPEDNPIVVRVVDVVGLRTLVTVHHQVPAAEIDLGLEGSAPAASRPAGSA